MNDDPLDGAEQDYAERHGEIARLKRLLAKARAKAKVDYAGLEAVKAAHDRLAAENGQLQERIRTLEAGIEREAADLDGEASSEVFDGDKHLAEQHRGRAARLRALLGEGLP